jgi:uncharacterized protein (TIGR02145 family)
MRTLILFSILLLNISFLFAQNNAPEVTNVTFSQRSDGSFIVDVYYDLNDADGDTMSVLMLVSDDAGESWNFSCDSITGAYRRNILSGSCKHIVWNYGSEHPETYGDQYRVKIISDDGKFETGTVADIDGNVYQTIKIGDQWWMAENLKVTHYRNGEAIPNVTDDEEWENLSTGAFCSFDDADSNIAIYGLLYNQFAVADSQNIAPAGWHVPSDGEWQTLVEYLGGENVAGGKMKATGTIQGGDGLWQETNEGATNESGFSALPGGFRYAENGYGYGGKGFLAYFWSVTGNCSRRLFESNSCCYDGPHGGMSQNGYSVRCVRD